VEFICAGRAFLVIGGPIGAPHLWFVLTDPDPQTNKVIAVMVVSERRHTDKTVALQPGDHPFITHASNLDFGGAKPVPTNEILARMKSGKWRPQPDMTPQILDLVRRGLLRSPRTVNHIVEYCRPLFDPQR
jgi:hypothetical protein